MNRASLRGNKKNVNVRKTHIKESVGVTPCFNPHEEDELIVIFNHEPSYDFTLKGGVMESVHINDLDVELEEDCWKNLALALKRHNVGRNRERIYLIEDVETESSRLNHERMVEYLLTQGPDNVTPPPLKK